MNVLFVTSWFPNPLSEKDGNFIGEHAHALRSEGHSVQVVHEMFSNRFLYPKIQTTIFEGIKVHRIELPKWAYSLLWLRERQALKIIHSLREEAFIPEVIHGHVMIPVLRVANIFRESFNVPLVFSEHWSGYAGASGVSLPNSTRESLMKSADNISRILPVSEFLKTSIQAVGISRPMEVVFNCVNTEIFKYEPREPVSEFTFLHISGFGAVKNVEGIMRAFQDLAAQNSTQSYRLVIAGDGDLSKLQNYRFKEISPDCEIDFIGTQDYGGVANLMNHADAFVLFSDVETFSCVAAEALCCGLPVIAPNVGALPERVNSENGILLKARSEIALSKAMLDISQNYDQYDRKATAESAKNLYAYSAISKQFLRIYQQVLIAYS